MQLLSRFGFNISERVIHCSVNVELESHKDALDYMLRTFSSGGKQNVALVGPLGVGKTTIVQAFAQQLMRADSSVDSSLKFRQVISLDAASLISAASGRGELEDLLNRLLLEAYHARGARYTNAGARRLALELEARARAARATAELPARYVLGEDQAPETLLDHVRLVSLGATGTTTTSRRLWRARDRAAGSRPWRVTDRAGSRSSCPSSGV